MKLSDLRIEKLALLREGEFEVLGLCGARPGKPFLTFAGDLRYLKTALRNPQVSCILCPPALAEAALQGTKGVCTSERLRFDFFSLHNDLAAERYPVAYSRLVQPTLIGSGGLISPLSHIAAQNVVIGDNVTIEEFVSIKENVRIGDDCIIRSGSVLGGSGLEFIRTTGESMLPVTHCGGLVIGERVEIQYNCNISRSLFPWDDTVIGADSKIESLVHIAHGVCIGERALIAASACLGGSTVVGDDVWIGPNATLSSALRIGSRSRISLGAVVAGNVPADQTVSGNFAVPHERFMREMRRMMLGQDS